jgi:hypothetical protein
MTTYIKCDVPSPGQVITTLILWPQAVVLFTTLAGVSLLRGMWLATLILFSFAISKLSANKSRLVNYMFKYIPDQQTLYNMFFLTFVLTLPVAIIGTLFFKAPIIRQIALFTWSLLIFLAANIACHREFGLSFQGTVTYLILHHIGLFTLLHFGFQWGIPFKLVLGVSILVTFIWLSGARQDSSKSLSSWSSVETPRKPRSRRSSLSI